MVTKPFLIMGGKVHEVKFPHRLIIPRMNPFSRWRFGSGYSHLNGGVGNPTATSMQSSVGKDDKLGVMGKVESGRELSTASEWIIQNGTCFVIFAYDAARSINLELAERR